MPIKLNDVLQSIILPDGFVARVDQINDGILISGFDDGMDRFITRRYVDDNDGDVQDLVSSFLA